MSGQEHKPRPSGQGVVTEECAGIAERHRCEAENSPHKYDDTSFYRNEGREGAAEEIRDEIRALLPTDTTETSSITNSSGCVYRDLGLPAPTDGDVHYGGDKRYIWRDSQWVPEEIDLAR